MGYLSKFYVAIVEPIDPDLKEQIIQELHLLLGSDYTPPTQRNPSINTDLFADMIKWYEWQTDMINF